jgi:hypothetical protein
VIPEVCCFFFVNLKKKGEVPYRIRREGQRLLKSGIKKGLSSNPVNTNNTFIYLFPMSVMRKASKTVGRKRNKERKEKKN